MGGKSLSDEIPVVDPDTGEYYSPVKRGETPRKGLKVAKSDKNGNVILYYGKG